MSDLPSSSHSFDIPSSKYDITLSALENASYFENCALSVEDVQTKLQEFSNLFNSLCRLSLLNCSTNQTEELIYLLLTLKKNIKWAILEVNESVSKKNYNFSCTICGANIHVEPSKNMWDTLQKHEHFEQMYHDFLNGSLDSQIMSEASREKSQRHLNSNTDSGIEHIENDQSTNDEDSSPRRMSDKEEDKDVNSFKFNFTLHYDEILEKKIYPPNIMTAIRNIDRISDYTMQKAGSARVVCLLCPCEVNQTNASKFTMVSHAMGQRHLRFSANPTNVAALRTYHETWLPLALPYQAHQVYFRPELKPCLKCCLCAEYIEYSGVTAHIDATEHRKRVLALYEKRAKGYFLTDLQVQVYGVVAKKEEVLIGGEEAEGGATQKQAKPKRHRRSETNESDSSDEQKHDIVESVSTSSSNNILEMLPNRYKPELEYISLQEDNTYHCELCKMSFSANATVEDIKSHIMTPPHRTTSKHNLKQYKYFCEICNLKINDELGWIAHHKTGPNKHSKISESRKDKVKEYECCCKTVIYGDEMSLSRHLLRMLPARRRKEKTIKLSDTIKKLFKSKDFIQSEADRLAQEAEEVLKTSVTADCCKDIEEELKEAFEFCKVYPFGSRISGLGNKHSDLDIFLDTGDMYHGAYNQDPASQIYLLRKATRALQRVRGKFQGILQIPTARTPIVKFLHVPTELDCDLSFRHGLSVENTHLLRYLIGLQPIMQPFVLVLKQWAAEADFDQVTTYAIAMLAIFYLQLQGYLPSIEKLRRDNGGKPIVIGGWQTIDYKLPAAELKAMVPQYKGSFIDLLKGFFKYFGNNFQYSTDVVCPLLGYILKKKAFEKPELLPPQLDSYIAQLESHSEDYEVFRANASFCVQDPFDLSHNLTKACQKGTTNKFKTLCNLTYNYLQTIK